MIPAVARGCGMSELHNTTAGKRRQSWSLVRAGIGGLVFVGMLLFLLWIPVMKTGRFDAIRGAGCFVLPLVLGACGVSAYCFFRAVQLRWPAGDGCCCLDCGYDLRGTESYSCSECGRAFDPNNPETFGNSHHWFIRNAAPGARSRAAIITIVLCLWSITAFGEFSFVPSMVSGPFIFVRAWDSWPYNVVAVVVALCVLAPTVLWVLTDRLRFAGLGLIAGVLSVALSFWIVFLMATGE